MLVANSFMGEKKTKNKPTVSSGKFLSHIFLRLGEVTPRNYMLTLTFLQRLTGHGQTLYWTNLVMLPSVAPLRLCTLSLPYRMVDVCMVKTSMKHLLPAFSLDGTSF